MSIRLFKNNKIIPIVKADTSNTKNVLIKVGVVGNIEKRNLPNAIDPTKNVINLIKKSPILLLKIPIKQAKPMQKLSPPYMPAISE